MLSNSIASASTAMPQDTQIGEAAQMGSSSGDAVAIENLQSLDSALFSDDVNHAYFECDTAAIGQGITTAHSLSISTAVHTADSAYQPNGSTASHTCLWRFPEEAEETAVTSREAMLPSPGDRLGASSNETFFVPSPQPVDRPNPLLSEAIGVEDSFETNDSYVSEDRVQLDREQRAKKKQKVMEERRKVLTNQKLEIICWIAHLGYLNGFCDDPFIQACIVSLYIKEGKVWVDPVYAFKFMCETFSVYKMLSNSWIFHSPPSRYFRGALRFKLLRAVQRRKACEPILSMLFVALCRCLRLHARLVLLPPFGVTEFHSSGCRLRLWSEIFSPQHRGWIAVDVANGAYDCANVMANRESRLPPLTIPAHPVELRPITHLPVMSALGGDSDIESDSEASGREMEADMRGATAAVAAFHGAPKTSSTPTAAQERHTAPLGGISAPQHRWPQSVHVGNRIILISLLFPSPVTIDFPMEEACSEDAPSLLPHPAKRYPHSVDIIEFPSEKEEERVILAYELSMAFSGDSKRNLSTTRIAKAKKEKQSSQWLQIPQNKRYASCFIFACNTKGLIRDVTQRYCYRWSKVLNDRGVELNRWLADNLLPKWKRLTAITAPGIEAIDAVDNIVLQEFAMNEPFPTTKSTFLKHPKFILLSMLKKNDFLSPQATVLGYFQGEKVYHRSQVWRLRTKDGWFREMRSVRDSEVPIKYTPISRFSAAAQSAQPFRTQPLGNRMNSESVAALPSVGLFAEWQTDALPPPKVEEGVLQMDRRGIIDLRGKRPVPVGSVHLKGLRGMTRLCREWDIPYASALVKYEFKGCKFHPVFDGVVVRSEDEKQLLQLHSQASERYKAARHLALQKRLKAIWKTLFKSILIYRYLNNSSLDEDVIESMRLKNLDSTKHRQEARRSLYSGRINAYSRSLITQIQPTEEPLDTSKGASGRVSNSADC